MSEASDPQTPDPQSAERLRRRVTFAIGVAIATLFVVVGVYLFTRPQGPLRKAVETQATENNARIVLQSCAIYAQEHSNRFPPNLAALLNRGLSPLVFLPPEKATTASTLTPEQMEAGSFFIYAGKDVRLINNTPPTVIVLYSREETSPGRRLLGFIDGSVQQVPIKDIPTYFTQNNTAREALGWPTIKP